MSDLVRVRIRGVEKNMSRALAETSDDVEIIDGPTHRDDGQPYEDRPLAAAPNSAGRYAGVRKADLEAEVAARNSARDEADQIDPGAGTVADLTAALEADDATHTAGGPQ